jgi:hypothetical protein
MDPRHLGFLVLGLVSACATGVFTTDDDDGGGRTSTTSTTSGAGGAQDESDASSTTQASSTAQASSSSGWATSGAGAAASGCAHDVCTQGAALTPGCDPCVDLVCSLDDVCCYDTWDDICVEEAALYCGAC